MNYQRYSLTMISQRYLCAFWLKMTPTHAYYARLDTRNIEEGWQAMSLKIMDTNLYGLDDLHDKMQNEFCFNIESR